MKTNLIRSAKLPAFASVVLCLFGSTTVSAQVPQLLNYQGRLVVNGANFTGRGQFEFALVSGSGTTTYWSNDGTSIAGSQPTNAVSLPVSGGLYSVTLGSASLANMTPVPYSVFANCAVFLRVWFDDGTHGWQQLSPDQRIAAVGYAMNSATANYVSSFAQATGTYAGMTVGTSAVATSALFGSTIQDTAHLAGMNNDWHATFSISGSGALVASGSGYYVVSGSNVPLASGTTTFRLSGTDSMVGGINLSGTNFIVRSTGGIIMSGSAINESGSNVVVMAGIGGPTLRCTGNGTLWCDGTDDYSTFQAVLNSATTTQALTVYIDSDFAVSNTPRILSNTNVIGWGGHGWHVKPNVNEPGIGMNLTGATIRNSNILIQNLPVDCNGPEQNSPRAEGPGFLQGSASVCWVVGAWFGSCTNVETDNLTIINACTFSRVWSWASNCVSNGYRNFWSDEEPPSQFAYQDHNFDGDHLWGPCTHMRFNNGNYMGDDDQMVQCPVEHSPEADGTANWDVRRGNGGPITDVIWSGNVMQNCRDAYRVGGQTTAGGTAAFENCMDQISYLNTSGTTWKNDEAWCDGNNGQYVGSVIFDGWYVSSGTSNAGSCLDFGNIPDTGITNRGWLEIPRLTLNNIQDGSPVYIYGSTAAGNSSLPAWDVSTIVNGNYIDDIHNLRNGIVAAWNFDTDTSGSAAFDWSGNGCALTNSNGVQFVRSGSGYATAMTGAAAKFSGSRGQVLVINGATCPNLATMPEWTVSFWTNLSSGPGGHCGPFEVLDGRSVQLVAQGDTSLASSGWDLIGPGGRAYAYANNGPRQSNSKGGGTQASPELGGHWMFYCIRKAVGGAIQVEESTFGGIIESTWSVPANKMTGANPVLVFGGRIDAGHVGSLNGYMDNIYIWKRCLSDHEVNLLWNPGTDGMPNQHYNDSYSWFWGGRAYPFNY